MTDPWRFDPEAQRQAERWLDEPFPLRTICNVLRQIHARTTQSDVQALCLEALWMAKKMDGRLRAYKQDWDTGLWLIDTGQGETAWPGTNRVSAAPSFSRAPQSGAS